jgi:hypothetical protein
MTAADFQLFHRSTGSAEDIRLMVRRNDVWEVGGILQLTADEWLAFREVLAGVAVTSFAPETTLPGKHG